MNYNLINYKKKFEYIGDSHWKYKLTMADWQRALLLG